MASSASPKNPTVVSRVSKSMDIGRKGDATTTITTRADEDDVVVEEQPKAHYNKQSVWLMILYSGLAIGSDGLYVWRLPRKESGS